MSITVQLLQAPSVKPIEMATHAALTCYQPQTPEMGKVMPVENALFKTGHHTTLEHTYYTFVIEGISVGDITLGFHLVNPFYNSDQRSGRYCSEMFANLDVVGIAQYIRAYYPSISDSLIWEVTDFVAACVDAFNRHLPEAAEYAAKNIRRSRPHFPGNEEALAIQADKIAQEQMRVLIPVIMPTAFDYTVNLSTLVALYKSAHTPVMRAVTSMMADLAVQDDPRIRFMFVRDTEGSDWSPTMSNGTPFIVEKPTCELISIDGIESFVVPDENICHPVDQLHFRSEMMDNSIGSVTTRLTLSLMTMGQNQRHRTVHRSAPAFTSGFYLPPLLGKCIGLYNEYMALASLWGELSQKLPHTLAAIIAPYGTMVTYTTKGDFNAIIHEHGKRSCRNAQEEIYHLSVQLREQIAELLGNKSPLLAIFDPPCYKHGKCLEGKRYCGREIAVRRNRSKYFPRRTI